MLRFRTQFEQDRHNETNGVPAPFTDRHCMMASKQKHTLAVALVILTALYGVSLFGRVDHFTMTPFREGQTAITAYYMAKGESPFLAYHLPVFGQPWAAPMEFPLYHWLAAQMGGADLSRLRWAGKLLSLACWGGCLWLAYVISLHAPLPTRDRGWFILLLAAAPIFVGYSTAFLMETFTLLLAMAYLWTYLTLTGTPKIWRLIAGGVFGTLAALSKATTWIPFAGVIALAMLLEFVSLYKSKASFRSIALWGIKVLILLPFPLAVGLAWVKYADAVKIGNPLASMLTSANLSGWTYGSLTQKLSPSLWASILIRQAVLSFGCIGLVTPIGLLLGMHSAWRVFRGSRQLIWILLALAGYVVPIVILTNLHYRHDYYLVANGFFLVAAVGLALSCLRDRWSPQCVEGLYLATFVSAVLVSVGYLGLKKSFAEPAESALINELRTIEAPGNVIYYGFDYSAHVPFEVERRALMMGRTVPDAAYEAAIAANKRLDWVAIALASTDYEPIAAETIRRLECAYPYRKEVWPGTILISKVPLSGDDRDAAGPDLLRRVAARVEAGRVHNAAVIYWHSWLSPAPQGEGFFELILRRGDDLFFIDGKNLRFYRLRHYFRSEGGRTSFNQVPSTALPMLRKADALRSLA
jgi:hypothetical protein